jgi:predicted MFS family arabinose efflux permease
MMLYRPPQRTLPIALLSAAGFLSSAGARVVDSLLDPIAHDFAIGVPATAWILAAFTIPYGLLQLVLGPLADRVGKTRVLFWALCAYAFATMGCALAVTFGQLTLMRALAGAASAGLIPVCLAYLGDITTYECRQVTLSRFLTGVVFAQVLAGPIGGLFGQFVSWRGVFVLLAAGACALAVRVAIGQSRLAPPPLSSTAPRRAYRALLRGRSVLFLLLTAFDGMVFIGTAPFVGPFLHERFGVPYLQAGLVLACFGVGTMLYVRNAARLVPRLAERGLVVIGGLAGALGLWLAAAAQNWLLCIPAEILLGLGYFMLHSVLQARATELLPNARSTATSGFAFMLFVGQAAGALLCARGIEAVGYRTVFITSAAGMVLLGLALHRLLRR